MRGQREGSMQHNTTQHKPTARPEMKTTHLSRSTPLGTGYISVLALHENIAIGIKQDARRCPPILAPMPFWLVPAHPEQERAFMHM